MIREIINNYKNDNLNLLSIELQMLVMKSLSRYLMTFEPIKTVHLSNQN